MEDDHFFAEVQVEPDAKNILKYLARIEKQQSRDCRIVCGYEAGCLGYSLYVHVLLGKHADTGNVVRNQTAHAGDSAVLTSMYSAMRRS